MCTLDVKICSPNEYEGTGPDGCQTCLPLFPIGPICTDDVKICAVNEYLGIGPDGCEKCFPRCKGVKCFAEITPIEPNIYPEI